MKERLSMADVFKALADENSLSLFNTISSRDTDSQKLMTTFALSKRQYYDRINDLRNAGLVGRQKGKYNMTSYGKVIYSLLNVIEKAIQRHWKLQAIDMMNFSTKSDSVGEDYVRIMDILLDDIEIKEILLKNPPSVTRKDLYSNPKSEYIIQSIQ
jgi:predicted transcriptional regulator